MQFLVSLSLWEHALWKQEKLGSVYVKIQIVGIWKLQIDAFPRFPVFAEMQLLSSFHFWEHGKLENVKVKIQSTKAVMGTGTYEVNVKQHMKLRSVCVYFKSIPCSLFRGSQKFNTCHLCHFWEWEVRM
jgi:hypothetical protein